MATLIDQLRRDHQDVRRLLDRIRTSIMSGQERQVLTGEMIKELRRHTHAESDVVEPATAQLSKADQTPVEASRAEHAAIDELLTRLEEWDIHDPDFGSRVEELTTKLDSHVEAYEELVVPRLEASLDADRLDELGLRFVQAKDEADNLVRPDPDPEMGFTE